MQTYMKKGKLLPLVNDSVLTPESVKTHVPKVHPMPRGFANAARPRDEFANFLTHFLGFLLSVAGSWLMLRLVAATEDRWLMLGCTAYCMSLMSLYAASTLSHAFYEIHRRHFYRKIDQVCIFYLIAGSFTPFALAYLRNGWWPVLTISMWVLATIGSFIILKNGFLTAGAQKVYILLGWLPAFSLFSIAHVAPYELVFWTVVGGLFYTTGTLFLFNDHRFRFLHAMWHTFVICGSICQYIAILQLVMLA